MVWSVVAQMFSMLLELIAIAHLSEQDKDLEILVLRKQLAMAEAQLNKRVRLPRAERLTLAVISARLKAATGRSLRELRDVIRLVKPATVIGWHLALVRWKWTYRQPSGGRPRTSREVERLVLRFARENADWGYGKIVGELLKLGHDISEETVANILGRHGIPPAPERGGSPCLCGTLGANGPRGMSE